MSETKPICFRKRGRRERGIVLVSAVALMIFLAIFTAVAASIVGTSAGSQSLITEGAQALALALAGQEWYFEQLTHDSDWSDETGIVKGFADGRFEISIDAAGATEITFTSTGIVPSATAGLDVRRWMTVTVQKLNRAFLFALFQGTDPGDFRIQGIGANNSLITGDVWSRGSVIVNLGNTVTGGKIYVPGAAPPLPAETVTGPGSYTYEQVSAPYLSMPVLDNTYYLNLMSAYNTLLDANTSNLKRTLNNTTFNIHTSPDCTAGVCNFKEFTTTGNVTITGSGTIVVADNISLHSGGGVGSTNTLTITPDSGGNIAFISNANVTIGRTSDPVITASSESRFYSRCLGSTQRLVTVSGANTELAGALILADRRIVAEHGADLTDDSVLFVNLAASSSRNLIQINGDGDVTSVDGTLISLSPRTGAIEIVGGIADKSGAVITGLVYARSDALQGGVRPRKRDHHRQRGLQCFRIESCTQRIHDL